MKCCGCNKAMKLTVGIIQGEPLWFEKVVGQTRTKVICAECIKDPEKKNEYKRDK